MASQQSSSRQSGSGMTTTMLVTALSLLLLSMLPRLSSGSTMSSTSSRNKSGLLLRKLHHSGNVSPVEQTDVRAYELWKPEEIRETVYKWAEHYPKLITVTTSQAAYGLPTAGTDNDCPFEKDNPGCLNYILTLQDLEAHPPGSASAKRLPEILWSGELHGNERVGPTAVLEAVDLLLAATACEALPRVALQPVTGDTEPDDTTAKNVWQNELKLAQSCRQDLAQKGIDDAHRRWLARLLTTRRIVVVPTANALGYYQNQREENGIDPNRDFPYDLTDPKSCMKTIAGRTLNEVFRQHLFQLSLTFHGGMEVVGYEWGAPSWQDPDLRSPDDRAQTLIAAAYSKYAGGWANTIPYTYGPMNDLVYPVRGGMEDWAYAGSWDPDHVIQCEPMTYNGYDKAKTQYDNSTLRVFNMLVETSNIKEPPQFQLGTSLDILTGNPTSNGHVARNIRLALLAAELVQPYVAVHAVNEVELTDDIVPLVDRTGQACGLTKRVSVPISSREVVVQWTVGGALTVDATRVAYATWDELLQAGYDCELQPGQAVMDLLRLGTSMGATSGTTSFHDDGGTAPSEFAASIDVSQFQPGDTLAVFAYAQVDQNWAEQLEQALPPLRPQSHIVNARTNPDWYHEKSPEDSGFYNGRIIEGRINWYSVPVTIVMTDPDEASVELSMRYDKASVEQEEEEQEEVQSTTAEEVAGVINWTLALVGTAVFCTVGYVGTRTYLHVTMRRSRREMVRDYIEDDLAVAPGLTNVVDDSGSKNGTASRAGGYSDGELEMGRYSDHSGLT